MIEYKAEFVGIDVKHVNESYTSQTCPAWLVEIAINPVVATTDVRNVVLNIIVTV